MKRSIRNRYIQPINISVAGYFIATIAILILTGSFAAYLWINNQYDYLERDSEHFEQEYLSIQKQDLEEKVRRAKQSLLRAKKLAESKLKTELQERVIQAHQIVESIYSNYKDTHSETEIKSMIYASLRNLRFNQNRSYYFIASPNGIMNLYPPNPLRENKHFSTFPEAAKVAIQKITDLIKVQEQGFIKYQWYSSGGKKLLDKYSYVKLFEPYNLIIGTGDYLELFEEQLKDDIYKRIADTSFGPNREGYFFINSYSGDLYVTNGQFFGGKKNLWETTDANGIKVVQENSRLAQENPRGVFTTYIWEKNSGEKSEKISFIMGMDEWEIFIGAGFYTDTLKNKVTEHTATRAAEFKHELMDTLKLSVITLIIIGILLFIMTRKLSHNLKIFSSNLENSVDTLTHLKPEEIHFSEFKLVGNSVNKMIAGLNEHSAALRHITLHDHLTALPNRRYVWQQLKTMLIASQDKQQNSALIFIDLDHFKEINDTLGHSAGDELLRQVSQRFSKVIRNDDLIARLGGDEFTVVTGLLSSDDEAEIITKKLINQLHEPFEIHAHSFHITASIGICLFPKDGDSPDTILRNGDSAMYQAKHNGRNGYCLYDASMTEAASKRLNLLDQLNEALKNDQFELYYQPQVCTETGHIIAAEALIRWHHPERGLVSPDQFIPFAEENGLIISIGNWVIQQALKDIKRWRSEGYNLPRIAVNFSTQQISEIVVDEVVDILKNTESDAGSIEFEITESALMENPELSRRVLQELHQLGISLSIDDFGQGYSSLSYLKQFPISKLKIDQAFIRDLEEDENDRGITRAIIALGQSLNMAVVAEGVETEFQLQFLKEEKCDELQGYLFSRPVPDKEFLAVLDRIGIKSSS